MHVIGGIRYREEDAKRLGILPDPAESGEKSKPNTRARKGANTRKREAPAPVTTRSEPASSGDEE